MKLFLLLFILIYSILSYKNLELYHNRIGHGWGFGILDPGKSYKSFVLPNPKCSPENNCFKGLPFRGSLYSNICEPKYKNLLRDKRYTKGECYRAHL